MSKKLTDLQLENARLKQQIAELNENTVISSMNDMKEEYDRLKQNSVPHHIYLSCRDNLRSSKNLIHAIEKVNKVVLNDMSGFCHMLRHSEGLTKERQDMIQEACSHMKDRILLVNEMIYEEEIFDSDNE